MFIGHYGVALALKKYDQKMSLGLLFVAVQLVDIIWGPLILLGIERVLIEPGITEANPLNFVHYPYTHSLIAFTIWSAIAFLMIRFFPINSSVSKLKAALIIAVAVFSHFVLDLIVHRPDLPLIGSDSLMLGLSLWDNILISFVLELMIFTAGLVVYLRVTKPVTTTGRYGLPLLAVVLIIMNGVNLWGPPPPTIETIGYSVIFGYPLFALLAHWLDKKRMPV